MLDMMLRGATYLPVFLMQPESSQWVDEVHSSCSCIVISWFSYGYNEDECLSFGFTVSRVAYQL